MEQEPVAHLQILAKNFVATSATSACAVIDSGIIGRRAGLLYEGLEEHSGS